MPCHHCGHNNPPENRFCGMCGRRLLSVQPPPGLAKESAPAAPAERGTQAGREPLTANVPPAGERTPAREETTVGGPSFLGLSNEPEPSASNSYSYLFQDEPEPSHKGVYVLLALLVIAGGLVYARWNPIRDYVVNTAMAHIPWLASAAPPAPKTTAKQPGSLDEPTINVAADQADTGAPQQPAATPPESEASKPMPESANTNASTDATRPAARITGHDTVVVTPKPNSPGDAQPDQSTTARPDAQPDDSDTGEETAAAAPRVSKPQPAPGTGLVESGERYLYGRGVRKDCDQAVTYFRAAAARQNPRAFGHLGTMYAIGQCVPLDRAVAYSWFSRALARDRGNRSLEQNMTMLWNEMTPAERQRIGGR